MLGAAGEPAPGRGAAEGLLLEVALARCRSAAFTDCRDVASLLERHTEEEERERESPHKGLISKLQGARCAPRQLLLMLLPAAAPGRPARQCFFKLFFKLCWRCFETACRDQGNNEAVCVQVLQVLH